MVYNKHQKELKDSRVAILNVLEDHKLEAEIILKKNLIDEAILASIGEGLVVTDKEGKITYVNNAFEVKTGWKRQEVLGKYIVEVIPRENEKGEVLPFNDRILTKVLSGEIVVADLINPFYYIRKDKTRFPASSIVTPIIINSEIIGVVETFRDITKEKEIDRAKTELVSLASHQLLTPLSIVSWYVEMLLAGDAGEITVEQKKYLGEIYTGNKRMIDLVNSLLGVSRMELGTFITRPVPTNVEELIQSVCDEQKLKIDGKQIHLNFIVEKNIPMIQADPKYLHMAVQNLLSNSVKYTPIKGKITISLELEKDKDFILLTVNDTGIGIPSKEQDKIFTKLFRAQNVLEKDSVEGTGLGLYIVKSIVEHSGGKVWFESVENTGTTFFVRLQI